MNRDERLEMMRAHIERCMPTDEEVRERCRKHLAIAAPTYLENWPSALKSLSIAQSGFQLDERTVRALMHGQDSQTFPLDEEALRALSARIDQELAVFAGEAFMRLGSRSPKDSFYLDRKTTKGDIAVQVLLESIRVWEDLHMALEAGYTPWLFFRHWQEIPEWAEFRCFMKDRQLTGISQYYYRAHYPELVEYHASIDWAIRRFFDQFKQASHLDTVVFDIFVKVRDRQSCRQIEVKLLEINPFSPLTDPCLFDWGRPVDFQGQMRFIESPDDVGRRDELRPAIMTGDFKPLVLDA